MKRITISWRDDTKQIFLGYKFTKDRNGDFSWVDEKGATAFVPSAAVFMVTTFEVTDK